jgi:hypothetical protein
MMPESEKDLAEWAKLEALQEYLCAHGRTPESLCAWCAANGEDPEGYTMNVCQKEDMYPFNLP